MGMKKMSEFYELLAQQAQALIDGVAYPIELCQPVGTAVSEPDGD
ncbi:MAG: hypothetical protein ACLSFZ_02950 [Frisingicoccus sp.]